MKKLTYKQISKIALNRFLRAFFASFLAIFATAPNIAQMEDLKRLGVFIFFGLISSLLLALEKAIREVLRNFDRLK